MEFQVAETVEELEAQQATLKRRIATLVDKAARGENDGSQITPLAQDAAALSKRIQNAKGKRDRQLRVQQQRESEQLARDLPQAREEVLCHRTAFLEHYRAACIELGLYLKTMARATALTNATATDFGVPLQESNALHHLDLGQLPEQALGQLKPDLGSGWKMSYSVRPMYE